LLSRLRARFRVGAIFISFLAVFAAPQSWGLGLGEIELDSALNQKFKATIELFDAASLESGEIIVSLGSSEDFQRIGVERFFFLTDLTFEVTQGSTGQPQITITSARPVTEPYLNFLVEVLWPSGRLLKEYTVLLDPPTFSAAQAPAVSAPRQDRTASNSGRVQRVEPATTGTQVQVAPSRQPTQPSRLDEGFAGDEYGMTDRDDTLWSIASQARPSRGVSVQQTMLAIQQMNPEAFINGNINLLKAGYVLRLPDESQAGALSAGDALAEVSRHHEEWTAFNRGEALADRSQRTTTAVDQTSDLRSPVDASSSTTPATAATGTDGELRIVAEDGDSTTGVGSQVASADLDAALEETDRLGRQVDELTYQLDRETELATNEIAVRERQINVKDQQIAELQAQLIAARELTQQQAQQPTETAAVEPQTQNQSTPAEAGAPWWQSPLVMYGGAGVLVLLLVGGMVSARKRRAAEEENDYFDAEEAFAEEERMEPSLDEAEEDFEAADDETVVASASDDEAFEEELEGSQTSDVIGEADIYIAYGRFPQAVGLLLGVLEDEPERNDVRIKLLEVYSETGDRSEFDTHMAALIEHCDDEEALLSARELENQFGEEAITLDEMMSENASDDASDDDRTVVAPIATAVDQTEESAASTVLDDEQPVTMADLEFTPEEPKTADTGLVFDPSSEDADADTPQDEASGTDTSALDFELELDDIGEPATGLSTDDAAEEVETTGEGAGDELGGDLGIDFDPDASLDFEAPEAETAQEESPAEESVTAESSDTSDASDSSDSSDRKEGFADTEELTIDADLEEAAASISSAAAEVDSEPETAMDEGDVAVETAVLPEAEADENLLDDLEFEAAAESDEEFEFQDEGDSANTKLDLARAYIDMGDADGARDILKEVVDEGNSDQQQKAQSMLEAL